MESHCRFDKKEVFDACCIIDHIPDIFLLVDDSGKIVMANNVLENILGWKPNEVIGAEIEVLLAPELRKSHKAHRDQFYKEPVNREMNVLTNLTALHKKGYAIPVDIKLSYMQINDRTYGTAIVRDASLQRELQDSLQEKNKKLEKILEEKNHLLGIAAHDMRNPIGIIQNFSQILQSHSIGDLNADQQEFVDRIYQSSVFMMGLMEDLLDFSAIESGTMNLRKEDFKFTDLLDEILLANNVRAGEKSIQLNVDCHSVSDISLTADKGKLHQVFNNLIDNAIKYSPQGSVIDISCCLKDGELVFLIKDQGVGIPQADLVNLFRPFFRAHNKPTSGEKSTGLGLFISKRIVEAHNGKLFVESKDGQGSTFTVQLTLA